MPIQLFKCANKKCKDVSPFSGKWNFIVILRSLHTIESEFKETAAMLVCRLGDLTLILCTSSMNRDLLCA